MEVWKLIVALVIGAVIGLERESQISRNGKQSHHLAGVRTLSLLAALGTISGILIQSHLPIFIFISSAFAVLLVTYYILHSKLTGEVGFTTELAILYSYIIGLLIAIEIFPIQFTLALSVIITLILSRKKDISTFIKGVQREELHAFISYALIVLVILPFLPNNTYSLSDLPGIKNLIPANIAQLEIFNPFKLWLIVVLVTGIDMAGYLLERTIGRTRGRLAASLIGGFISSTATTISLAVESKTVKKGVNYLVAAAVFANAVSFIPLFFLVSAINANFLPKVIPMLLILIFSSLLCGVYFFKKRGKTQAKSRFKDIRGIKESEIFSIVPALKFGFLFLIITVVTQVALKWFGQTGFIVASSIASLTGVDAVTLNISQQAGKNINFQTAALAFFLMNAVNLFGKSFYSFFQGNREFAVKFTIAVIVIIASSFIGFLFV